MTQVNDWLNIGNIYDLEAMSRYGEENSIHAVLNLAENLGIKNKSTLYLPVDDGVPLSSEHLVQGLEFLLDHYHYGHQILVACGAGVSRSATFCTVLLKEVKNLSLIEAFKILKARHAKALPHPELWKSVCEFYEEKFEYHLLLNEVNS